MHRVVPELIVQNYRQGRFSGDFSAVGMFLDLSGFSTMTDALMQHGQHGAEVLASLMHGVFDPLVESIFNYGGKIVGFAGDGIMALYPIDGDVQSTCLGALAAAWVIQNRLSEESHRHTIYGTFQFTARIGLTCGSVSWGILHSEDRRNATYFFRGSAVDDCTRAEQHAVAGEILITQDLYTVVQSLIQASPNGSFYRLSGFNSELPGINQLEFPPVDLEISRIFMPEEVIAQDAHGEFRQVVNLFMRFPEVSNEKLDEITRVVFNLRQKYGGLLNRVDFGDKGCNMLMLWGAPVAYENDIGRALNFLLDFQSRLDIPVTAGVTYYVAHAGYLGSVMCEDYTCYGWGVNLASRFMMNAPQGEIWVDDRIARRVSSRFRMEFLGAQRFKGFSAEQRVHRLGGYNPKAESVYQGEMIGRERELSILEKFVEPIWKGDFAGVLLVLGDAGIGKGRLVQHFRFSNLFETNNALWAVCQSEQILRQSFNPFRSWLLHYFGFTSQQDAEARRDIFDEKLKSLMDAIPPGEPAQELDRLRSLLAALVDLFWPDSLYEQLDAEARYNSTLLALIALMKAESLRQPLILFVEDVQFIDEDSLNFLPQLKRAILAGDDFYPIAIVATSRREKLHSVLEGDFVDERITLSGLPREATARLIETLLGGVPSLALVNLVMDRSEGNPYFVEQIIRYLQEESLIEMSQDGWRQVSRIQDLFLPGDIGALLIARLDQLSRRVKEVVQTASVFGREFVLSVLVEMTQEGDAIERCVWEAEQSAIWTSEEADRYVFNHGLLRDAAYTMQMRSRRQELHRLAVTALEKIYAKELKFHYVELAFHAERAELRDKTRIYYILAGRAAAEAFQNVKGIEYFSRALSFTPFGDLATQFEILVERVELFKRTGDHDLYFKDLETLERLVHELGGPQREALVEMLYTHYFIIRADYPAVIQHAERVLALSQEISNSDIVLKAYQVWPLALLRTGRLEEAMRIAQEGRRLAEDAGDLEKEGYILMTMGLIAVEQQSSGSAHGYFQRAMNIAQAIGNKRLESRALANLGYSAGFLLQDYALAYEFYEQGYELYREFGERYQQATSLLNLGWVAGMLGDPQAAYSYYVRALPLTREIGNPYNEAYTLINLSANAGLRMDSQGSLEYGQKALELCRKTSDRSGEAWSFLYLGYAYLLVDDLQRAEESFRACMSLRDELGQPGLKPEPQAGLIQAFLAHGQLDEALAEVETILPYLEQGSAMPGTEEPLRVYYACYLALERAQDPRAKDVLHSAMQLLDTQVSKLRDDRARKMFVENVPWRLALRQAWQAR